MQTIIDSLNWRYAVKQYDNTKKITSEELKTLKEVVRLTPTSAGLQPFKLIVVADPDMKNKLAEASLFNGTQVSDASHLFILAAQKTVKAEDIDTYMDLIVQTRGVDRTELAGFEQSMKGYLLNQTDEQSFVASSRQAYIALGLLISAAASMRIDATPMEGFDRTSYDDILGLTDHSTVVICAIGHRSAEDRFQHLKKVRKPEEIMITTH